MVTTTPIALKNEFSTFQKIYYDKATRVMINQPVNEFYTRFIFKIDALPHYVVLKLDITAILFDMLIHEVRELLISGGVQVPPRMPTKTNHQGNQRLLLVINAAVDTEEKI